nr:SLC13 family permease [Caldisericum exile]
MIILLLVVAVISIRNFGRFKVEMWQAMATGALLSIILRQISIKDAIFSINFEIIFFLFFMFVIGSAFELSGLLEFLSFKVFKNAKNVDTLILQMIFVFGILSSIFTNDTIAIVGTSLGLILSRNHKISPKLILLTVAFSVTIGSTFSPIGNPQNLIIAVLGKVPNPFVTFFKFNFIPMIVNLIFTYLILKLFYKNEFHEEDLTHELVEIQDIKLAKIVSFSSIILIILILAKISIAYINPSYDFPLVYIAAISALPIIIFSNRRIELIKEVDYKTLLFFISMFILMRSVFLSGIVQNTIKSLNLQEMGRISIFITSILVSQLVSNVPAAILLLPFADNSIQSLMALSSGTTIAGNLTILGAASNIIAIQKSEKVGHTITFWEFSKVGVALTLQNIITYSVFYKVFLK